MQLVLMNVPSIIDIRPGTLHSARAVSKRIGVSYRVLDHWQRSGAIPTRRPANGYGSAVGYSPGDIANLAAIATVRRDLAALGVEMSVDLVARTLARARTLGRRRAGAGQ